jgi:CheY-like chemotaxis protein
MMVGYVLKQRLNPYLKTTLRDADELLHQSLDYTRSLVSELTPQALYERGLGPALQWLGDQMRRQKVLNVEIVLDAPELALPEADSVLLFQSIRELLFNVLKHGQTDRASVSMRYAQDVLTITVSDQGRGFDVSRLRDDPSDRFGLLSIRERMTALGGTLDLQSEPGKGTVASLCLPFTGAGKIAEFQTVGGAGRVPSPDATPLQTNETDSAAPSFPEADIAAPLRVMLVDDFDLVRKSLRSLLEQHADVIVVGEASSGEQALQLACSLNPDVVIMDMHMPGWDGAETTRRILKERPATVVIGLSIQTDSDIAKSMLEAGAAAFIAKETAVNELYSTLRTATPRMTSSRSLSSRPLA